MEEIIIPIVVVPVIFFSIATMLKTISDNSVRRRIVDRGVLDENVKYLFVKQHLDFVPNSLKWGMVMVALGLAVLIGKLAPSSFQEEAMVSAMFILGGTALISYYFVARKFKEAEENKRDELAV